MEFQILCTESLTILWIFTKFFQLKNNLIKLLKKFCKTDKIICNAIYSNASHPKQQTKKALKIKK